MKHMKTVPLLQSQLGIYLQCKRLGGTAYNQHWLYILDDAVDPDRLADAIDRVMAFYPSLNTLPYLPTRQECPISEDVAVRIACLPLYYELNEISLRKILSIIYDYGK